MGTEGRCSPGLPLSGDSGDSGERGDLGGRGDLLGSGDVSGDPSGLGDRSGRGDLAGGESSSTGLPPGRAQQGQQCTAGALTAT